MQHAAIRSGDLAAFKRIIENAKDQAGKTTTDSYNLLETRDRDGKTCFFTAVELAQTDIINYLLDAETFPNLDIFNCRDTFSGDTPLHVAARNGQHELAQKLFAMRPDKCMQ